jgi:hypothetical protein
VCVTQGSAAVTAATPYTQFLSQLTPGQFVVLRGVSYKVTHVADNANFYIQPPYRGTTNNAVTVSVTLDTRTPQSQWNMDPCDGSGPASYVFNPRKIQMIYFDFSWYGASSIRYGLQDNAGNTRYVHKYIHTNQHNSAFFRAAHLPARYEVVNPTAFPPTWTPSLTHWGTSVILDGGHQPDKGYLFSASSLPITFAAGVTPPQTIPMISLRAAPSADASIGGALGSREIVHRAQVQPHALEILASQDTEITLLLNASTPNSWTAADRPSLCQVIQHEQSSPAIEGGMVVFRGTVAANAIAQHSLQRLLPLGNSILGGDGVYPNGPDVLTVVAKCLGATGSGNLAYTLFSRLVWEE